MVRQPQHLRSDRYLQLIIITVKPPMSISAITIENFKGIKEPVRVELKPITLLFGPNSAGKSTIVQALQYAWEIFEQGILDPDRTMHGGESIDLGGFQNMVHGRDITRSIRLRFEFAFANDAEYGEYPFLHGKLADFYSETDHHLDSYWSLNNFTSWMEISIRWSDLLSAPFIHSYKLGFNDETYAEVSVRDDVREANLSYLQANLSYLNLTSSFFAFEDGSNSALAYLGPAVLDEKNGIVDLHLGKYPTYYHAPPEASLSSPGAVLAFSNLTEIPWLFAQNPDGQPGLPHFRETSEFRDHLCSMLRTPLEYLRLQLKMFKYIGPLRKIPGRNYRPPSSYSSATWADGQAAWDTLFKADDDFLEKVNTWLADRLDTGFRVKRQRYREVDLSSDLALTLQGGNQLDADIDLRRSFAELAVKTRLKLHDLHRDVDVDLIDVGVGLSQVLPIVVLTQLPIQGLIAIEQPELHVHPALQVALGDLFIESIETFESAEKKKIKSIGKILEKMKALKRSGIPQIRWPFDSVGPKIFLVETHSEHLLLRLLKRIRQTAEGEAPPEQQLTPAEVGIHFIEQRDGRITVSSIRVNEDGEFLDHWPRGFFTERAEELF